jgi:peroxiredoxin
MRATILAVMVMMLVAGGATAGEFNKVVDIGAPMPSFENLPATDGSTLSSKDLTEDIVVLVFLANHCPWVMGMDADLVNLVKHFEGKNVRVVGVSPNHREDDRLPAMKEHAKKYGYNFTYVFDESQDVGRKLGATRTPEYFVFDKSRKLAYMGAIHNSPARKTDDGSISYTRGEPTEFYVKSALEAMLAGKKPDPAETRAHGCSIEYEKK